MLKQNLKNFDKAYKSVVKDSRSLNKIGAYKKVGDYRDVVNDATYKVIAKYGESLYQKSVKEIASLIVHSMKWVRLSKMRTKKDLSSEFFTNYISEFENFDITFRSDWLHNLELKIDSEINNLPNLVDIVDGTTSTEYIESGVFPTKRVALYQTSLQVNRYRKLIERDSIV